MDHHIKSGNSIIGVFLEDLEDKKNQSLDDWMPKEEYSKLLEGVSARSDVTVSQVHQSEDDYNQYVESVSSTKRVLDALTASKIDDKLIPKKPKQNPKTDFIYRFGRYEKNEDDVLKQARVKVGNLSDRHRFFHWETEMRDAFTDSRRGFDVILGNPPWDKVKIHDDEFFTPYYPAFRSLSPKSKKNEIKDILLNDKDIKFEYDDSSSKFEESNRFFTTYKKHGKGDKELSKLVLERSLNLLTDGGVLSMVLPSQILSSTGSADIRKEILDRDIQQLYVFENRKKIFNIDSRYRFMLLTIKNIVGNGSDTFPVGFYLHNLSSLRDKEKEKEKFGTHSKEKIKNMFSKSFIIPETVGNDKSKILEKIYKFSNLSDGLDNGITASFSRGFDKTNDSDLFREDGRGWPLHEGKTTHQYSHVWSRPKFTVLQRAGLERENKPKYDNQHRRFYDSYRLVFRNISSPTNMRTVIATIVPPRTFSANSMSYVILRSNGILVLDGKYLQNILYLCGVLNSTPFDFVARQLAQVNMPAILGKIPIPHENKKEIAGMTAKLTVGHQDFAGLADALHIPNEYLSVSDRIDAVAKLDTLVAKSYGLDKEQYTVILDSFTAFKENSNLRDMQNITWNDSNLKEFYGEMSKKALEIF